MKEPKLYQIQYKDPVDGKNISLQVRNISDSPLGLSFIMISGFVFPESELLIQPAQEQLKKRFEKTKTLHLSIYSVISIEELSSAHLSFKTDKSKLLMIHSETKPPVNRK